MTSQVCLDGIGTGLLLGGLIERRGLSQRQMGVERFHVKVEDLETQEQIILVKEIDVRMSEDKIDELREIVGHVLASQEHVSQKLLAEIVQFNSGHISVVFAEKLLGVFLILLGVFMDVKFGKFDIGYCENSVIVGNWSLLDFAFFSGEVLLSNIG